MTQLAKKQISHLVGHGEQRLSRLMDGKKFVSLPR
jgi:hypothetical protein